MQVMHAPLSTGQAEAQAEDTAGSATQVTVRSPLGMGISDVAMDGAAGLKRVSCLSLCCVSYQPERTPHVILDSASHASPLPETDALERTPDTIAAEPCGEHDGDGSQLPATPLVLETTGTQVPGGQVSEAS